MECIYQLGYSKKRAAQPCIKGPFVSVVCSARVNLAKGHPAHPVTDEEFEAKFDSLVKTPRSGALVISATTGRGVWVLAATTDSVLVRDRNG